MKTFTISLAILAILLTSCSQPQKEKSSQKNDGISVTEEKSTPTVTLFEDLTSYVPRAEAGFSAIPNDRKEALNEIAQYIKSKKASGDDANLIFICTHNSRRSHLCQIWAAVASHHYNVAKGVNTFSGGTEATAFNPRAVAAIERAGLKVENPGGLNPMYKVTFAEGVKPIICFSKIYNDLFNPSENFAAIMTCSEADSSCPFIPGASLRVSLPYLDPKVADNTPEETMRYDERCLQIATEMLYIFSLVKNTN
jgi:arsenate reductase